MSSTRTQTILFCLALCSPYLAAQGCGDDGTGEPSESSDSGAGGSGGSGGTDAGAEAPSCSTPTLEAGGDSVRMIEHGGETRSYRLHVPADLDLSQPVPLIVNWHGLTSSASEQEAYSGVNTVADARGYVVAHPEGLGSSFNGGVCCSDLGEPPHMADDVGFGKAIIEDIAAQLCLDRTRVYSTGMSNGGFMSEWNACQAADTYAAVAPVSAIGLSQMGCAPSRPVPLLAFNGTEDSLVSYEGSQTSVMEWLERNGCEGEPERTMYGDSYCDAWTDCDAGAEVVHCTIPGMEHCWPGKPLSIPGFCEGGGLDDIDATPMIFDFFDRFTLP